MLLSALFLPSELLLPFPVELNFSYFSVDITIIGCEENNPMSPTPVFSRVRFIITHCHLIRVLACLCDCCSLNDYPMINLDLLKFYFYTSVPLSFIPFHFYYFFIVIYYILFIFFLFVLPITCNK